MCQFERSVAQGHPAAPSDAPGAQRREVEAGAFKMAMVRLRDTERETGVLVLFEV